MSAAELDWDTDGKLSSCGKEALLCEEAGGEAGPAVKDRTGQDAVPARDARKAVPASTTMALGEEGRCNGR